MSEGGPVVAAPAQVPPRGETAEEKADRESVEQLEQQLAQDSAGLLRDQEATWISRLGGSKYKFGVLRTRIKDELTQEEEVNARRRIEWDHIEATREANWDRRELGRQMRMGESYLSQQEKEDLHRKREYNLYLLTTKKERFDLLQKKRDTSIDIVLQQRQSREADREKIRKNGARLTDKRLRNLEIVENRQKINELESQMHLRLLEEKRDGNIGRLDQFKRERRVRELEARARRADERELLELRREENLRKRDEAKAIERRMKAEILDASRKRVEIEKRQQDVQFMGDTAKKFSQARR